MNKKVAGIVLAAGRSSRMGRPKALLPLGSQGQTFLTRIVETFRKAGMEEILVVTAAGSELTSVLLSDKFPFRLILNESPELGQLSSFQVGLQSLDLSKVSGTLMTPVDVPLVSVETVKSLIEAHSKSLAPVVRPVRKKHMAILLYLIARSFKKFCLNQVIQQLRQSSIDIANSPLK